MLVIEDYPDAVHKFMLQRGSFLDKSSYDIPPDRRGGGEEGRRFNVYWSLTAGHRKMGAIRGQVMNVSVSGVLICVPVSYELGTVIEIEMSPSFGVFIRALIQIKRENSRSGGSYYYGATFKSQKDEDLCLLRELLLKMRRQELAADFAR